MSEEITTPTCHKCGGKLKGKLKHYPHQGYMFDSECEVCGYKEERSFNDYIQLLMGVSDEDFRKALDEVVKEHILK
jgi:hypothetical protein